MTTKQIFSSAIIAGVLLSAAPAFAQSTTGTAAPSTSSQSNLTCVQAAVDAREQAIDSAFTTFSSAESAALSARATALHAAWGITDSKARRAARTAAWSAFATANKSAYAALRTARKAAWSTFTTASKACHTAVVETSASEGAGSLGL